MTEEVTLVCSFCGKNRNEVKILVAGGSGHICESCTENAVNIIKEHLPDENKELSDIDISSILANLNNPRFIFEKISDYVVGMDTAKKVLSVAVYNHFNRLAYNNKVKLDKSNILILGPTGSGKTHLIKAISNSFKIPISISNATALTEAGYVGLDVQHILFQLYEKCQNNLQETEHGIIYIDEIDKIAKKGASPNITRDVSGEGVQQALLALLEDSEVYVSRTGGRLQPEQKLVKINTGDILFVCGGAFYGLEEIILTRLIKEGLIKSEETKGKSFNANDIRKMVSFEDLITYGLIPEFAGRFNYLIVIDSHDKMTLKRILVEPKNSLVNQYTMYLKNYGIDLIFEEEAIDSIVDIAINEFGSGARSLKHIVSKMFIETMFEIASIKNLKKCIINKRVVIENKLPVYINEEGNIVSIKNGQVFIRDKVFISYSRDDEYWMKEIEKMMNPLLRNNSLNIWFDGKIKPSQKWREEIEVALTQSKVALLLVSPSFLNSRYVMDEEIPYFLKLAGQNEVKIAWLLINDCLYEETPISEYQALHDIKKPLSSLSESDRNTEIAMVVRKIKDIAKG